MAALVNHRYRLRQALGAGQQGSVWLAEDLAHEGAARALKFLHPGAPGAPGSGGTEASGELDSLCTLSHPGLARVFSIESVESVQGESHEKGGDIGAAIRKRPFLVCEFVAGESCADRVAGMSGPTLAACLLDMAEQLGSALSHLHARSRVHGDIKPDNLRWADRDRLVLLDLGLSRSIGEGQASGSVRYMAPEALTGYQDARSDLYSLGASLFELASGQPLFTSLDRRELLAHVCKGVDAQHIVGRLPGELPEPLVELLVMLLASDAGRRPSGAMALLAHVQRIREAAHLPGSGRAQLVSVNFSRPEFVGRKGELEEVTTLLADFSSAPQSAHTLLVVGATGSGRRRVVEEALLRYQLSCSRQGKAALPVHDGIREAIWPGLDSILSRGPAIVALYDDGDPGLASLASSNARAGLLLILCLQTSSAPPFALAHRTLHMPMLSTQESTILCRSLAPQACSNAYAQRVHELSQGVPGAIRDMMAVAASLDPEHTRSPDSLLKERGLASSLIQRMASLSSGAAQTLEVLAVAGEALPFAHLAALSENSSEALHVLLAELMSAGFVVEQDGKVTCLSAEQAQLIDSHVPLTRRRALHRRCLQAAFVSLRPATRARHLLVCGPNKAAQEAALVAIEDRRAAGRIDEALQLCLASADQMKGKAASEHAAQSAELALASGDYALADDYGQRASRSRVPAIAERGLGARARVSEHRGQAREATVFLEEILAKHEDDAQTRARLAKNLLLRGKFEEAEAQGRRALGDAGADASQGTAASTLALETLGLVALYRGETSTAAQRFQDMAARCDDAHDKAGLGRARALQGMCAQKQGKLADAADFYGQAHTHAINAGAWHAAAVALLNRATVEHRRAHYAQALDSLASALPGLQHSGTPFELAAAHCNRGNLLLMLGEIEAARSAANVCMELAQAATEPRLLYFARLLLGDIAWRTGDQGQALADFDAAHALATQHELADGVHAALRLQEMRAHSGLAPLPVGAGPGGAASSVPGRHPGNDPGDSPGSQPGDSLEHQAETITSQARVQLATGSISAEHAERIASFLETLDAADELDLGWRLAIVHAQLRVALGNDHAAHLAIDKAQERFDKVLARSPEAYRQGLRAHPDARSLIALVARAEGTSAAGSKAGPGRGILPLRGLLSLSRRLNSELRLGPLLDDIIDTAIDLSRAERAFLLLNNGPAGLEIRVARNIAREDLGADATLSRSIAEEVLRSGQAIMTVDAESDTRFGASQSVAALRLRSILAVPFRVKDRVVGTLYLDHRFRRGAFDEDAVEVVRELADIAAVAIENARLVSENRRRERENAELAARLAASLEDAEARLVIANSQLVERPQHGFRTIIGDSSALRSVLSLAERAARTDLSVVIAGESGTGKELLARALHEASDRQAHPFVALNCGAVPDSLLESELFGHRKGAFTGADRGRRGLFQVADKGTLFLDEIADTSLAMQSKLLRALQDGEIRPLGAEELVHVDVRIICASHQPLEPLVEQGLFRQDLYYRLHVMSLTLPPLRERISDVDLLVEHILHKRGHRRGISSEALASLRAYHWPGNVRELDNELTRASAMADDSRIEEQHLGEAVRAAQATHNMGQSVGPNMGPKAEPATMLLKPRVERLERKLVEEAMAITEGNQSKAALLLGLSRYGLQKKLLRYGIAGSQRS